MHNQSFYNNIAVVIAATTSAACILSLFVLFRNFFRWESYIRAFVHFTFPRIFTTNVIVAEIQVPTARGRGVTQRISSDGVQYKELICFEGRKIKDEQLKTKIYAVMFVVAATLVSSVISTFFMLLLLDISYDCEAGEEYLKDCFKVPKFGTYTYSSPPLNCSSILDTTTEVVCYRLVFNFNFAAAVSYGLFKLAAIMFHVVALLCLKFIHSGKCCPEAPMDRRVGWFKLTVLGVLYVPTIILLVVLLAVSVELRIAFRKSLSVGTYLQIVVSIMMTLMFVGAMPWEHIVDPDKTEDLCANQVDSTQPPGTDNSGFQ